MSEGIEFELSTPVGEIGVIMVHEKTARSENVLRDGTLLALFVAVVGS